MTDAPRPACPCCHRPDPAGQSWAVCGACQRRVDRQLADLLDLHALANTVAALEPASNGEHSATVHRDPPLPLNLAALDLAIGADTLGVLESWERWWREHWDLAPYGVASAAYAARTPQNGPRTPATPGLVSTATSRTLMGVVGFLRAWWPRAATVVEPPPEEFAAEVRTLHNRARAALALTEPRPWTVPCPADHPDHPATECGYRLPVTLLGGQVVMHCPRCRSTWTVDRLLLVAAAAGHGVWVDAETAAQRLGVTQRTLQRMAERGDIQRRYHRYDISGGRHATTG